MKKRISSSTIRRLVSIGLVLLLAIIYIIISPEFLSMRNISMLLKDAAYLGIVAVGLSVVMIGGGIDLSVGGIVCATGIILAHLSVDIGLSGYLLLPLAIVIGALFGTVNGLVVAKIGLTEFVATLATGFVYSGIGLMLAFKTADGRSFSQAISSSSYRSFGQYPLWENGFYLITFVWVVISILLYVVLRKTQFGVHTFAMGSNARAASMSGVNVTKVKTLGFVISGGCSGLAAFLVTSNLGTSPTLLGNGYDFQAIAACVVGGVVLGGGKGDAINALIGALFMLLLMNGIYKLGLSTPWQYIFQGGIIIIATAFDAQFAKIAFKRRMKEQRLSTVTA